MNRTIRIEFNGKKVTVPHSETIRNLLGYYPHPGELPPLGARVNGRLYGLYEPLIANCVVETVDYSSKDGNSIYRSTLQLILGESLARLYPEARLRIGHSISNGYFYEVDSYDRIFPAFVEELKDEMTGIVREDLPVSIDYMGAEEAETLFLERGYPEKAALVEQFYTPILKTMTIGEFTDILHTPVADRTGLVRLFDLVPYANGMLLCFPQRNGKRLSEVVQQPKLFAAHRESRQWSEVVDVWNISQINDACIRGKIGEIIRVSEGLHEKKIANIADGICERLPEVKLVLIAGPSSSGKTTSTKRLETQLRVNGIMPVSISVDNYYVNRVDTPKFPDGSYDFECIEALDVDLFAEHLERLLAGEKVETPIYNFVTGEREKQKTIPMQLKEGQILMTEGIHCLNDALTPTVPSEAKFKLYISALMPLTIDRHNRIFTSETRLIRRLVRDRLYRGYSAEQTITQWPKVRGGENKYIFPFQEEADMIFNSALVYEFAVLKTYARRFLHAVPRQSPAYSQAAKLYDFLHLFLPVFPEEVPPTSVLREFIGGSTFSY